VNKWISYYHIQKKSCKIQNFEAINKLLQTQLNNSAILVSIYRIV